METLAVCNQVVIAALCKKIYKKNRKIVQGKLWGNISEGIKESCSVIQDS